MTTYMKFRISVSLAVVAAVALVTVGQAGDLDPPVGPIAPTMKTLDQVEPRIPLEPAEEGGGDRQPCRYWIVVPGSYYLGSNATIPLGFDGICIDASNVSLDLRGHTLSGASGSLDGIKVLGTRQNIAVFGGIVTGFGGTGVNLSGATNCLAERLQVSDCQVSGITAGPASNINQCVVSFNWVYGIDVGVGSAVIDCKAYMNGIAGIRCAEDGLVDDCVAAFNGDYGIVTAARSTVVNSTSSENSAAFGGAGIKVEHGSTVSSCTASYNQEGTGIVTGAGCTVETCTTEENGDAGIVTEERSSVIGCTAAGNGFWGMGVFNDGIHVGSGCSVVESNGSGNAQYGILASQESTITDCTTEGNVDAGIKAIRGCTVVDSTSESNGAEGILCLSGDCVVTNCTVRSNSNEGINAHAAGMIVSGCTATDNGSHGIRAQGTITGCTANANGGGIYVGVGGTVSGCTAIANSLHGIRLSSGCYAVGNTCRSNDPAGGGAGIDVDPAGEKNRIERNHVTANDVGIRCAVGTNDNLIVSNSASCNTTMNYDLAPTNHWGPIVTLGGGPLPSSDPWANFDY